jgi:predicted dehydrogenase
MEKNLAVALVGYGNASKIFHAPLITATPGLSLVKVVSSDAAKVHADWPEIEVVANAQTVFDDPNIDLVVIPTPNTTHFPLAQQALQAGKHVVVDKPFTVDVAQAKVLAALAVERQRVLSVFHNRRWDADFLTLKALLAAGTLGEVVYFESHFDRYRPQVQQRWREADLPGSGIWYDLGAHLLDQALQLFGMPEAINSDQAMMRPGAQSVDYFHTQLIYPQRRVVLHGSVYACAPTPRYLVQGRHGSYVKYGLDPQEALLKQGVRLPVAGWGQDSEGCLTLWQNEQPQAQPWTTQPGNYPAYYAAVRDAILGKGENPVTPEQAIDVMRLIELGIESHRSQRTVPVTPAE